MGCASSKSTPVVESNPNDGTIGKTMLENGKSVLMDVENRIDDLKDGVHDAAEKLESALLSSPATERAGGNVDDELADGTDEVTGSETTDGETNAMSLKIENPPDDSDGLLTNDKPPTPMPEAVKMNAQWPFMASESGDKPPHITEEVSRTTPLDTIAEEKRLVTIPSSEEMGATTVEILTIEIAEIPIEDDPGEENDQNKDDESEKEKSEEKEE